MLYIAKGYKSIFNVKSHWLHHLVLQQCLCEVFINRRQFIKHVIPSMVAKTMENYLFFALNDYITIIASFDLWMFQASFDTFVLVVNFVNSKWLLYHVV